MTFVGYGPGKAQTYLKNGTPKDRRFADLPRTIWKVE